MVKGKKKANITELNHNMKFKSVSILHAQELCFLGGDCADSV